MNWLQKWRPQNFDQLFGQSHLKKLLKAIITKKLKRSFIFYGPSGVGKTSSALILAQCLNLKYTVFSASSENKATLVTKLDHYQVLIIDEIHRLNKQNQELLLTYIEAQKIIVYATTTENPYFKILPALRSRLAILVFKKLSETEMLLALETVLAKSAKKNWLSKTLLKRLISYSQGDLRHALNNLELVFELYQDQKISLAEMEAILPLAHFSSDQKGDQHYHLLSAFHKSLRGSDVDAALYYAFLIIKSGDLDGFYRRLLSVAYEDVGLANTNLELKVFSSIQAIERMGFPNSNIVVAKIVSEVALSAKSNATTLAMQKWLQLIEAGHLYEVPNHLKDNHYASAAKLNHGLNYLYPHHYVNHFVKQNYLPKELAGLQIFKLGTSENEQKYAAYWKKIKAATKKD